MELTIQQYADSKGLTYQAISQKIKKSKELQALIVKRERTRYLTDEAQKLLDQSLREKNITRITNPVYERQLKQKETEIERLKASYEKKLAEKDQAIIDIQKQYLEDKANFLELKQQILEEKEKLAKDNALYLVDKENFKHEKEQILANRDKELLLVATSRKERRRIKKELKNKAKNDL